MFLLLFLLLLFRLAITPAGSARVPHRCADASCGLSASPVAPDKGDKPARNYLAFIPGIEYNNYQDTMLAPLLRFVSVFRCKSGRSLWKQSPDEPVGDLPRGVLG